MRKPNGYWTFEKCKEEALKYNSRWEFGKNTPGAYNACIKNKWSNLFSHMKEKKRRNYWSYEKCKEEALKYNSRNDFAKNSFYAYSSALKNNWLDTYEHLYKQKYTKEYCKEITKKYKSHKSFIKNNAYLYAIILKNNWNDELFSHFIKSGNLKKRCIYAYEFNDNYVYVGLTYNLINRNNKHMKKGPVYNHIQKSKIKPKLKQLTDYINVENAKIEEQNYIFDYKKNGWKILNKAKAGAIGGNIIKWTYEKCKNEALKYNNRTEYFKNSTSYYAASRNGWLKEICSHMKKYEKI